MEQTEKKEFQNQEGLENQSENGGQEQPETVKVEDYKNLQGEFTKVRQAQIDLALRLAQKDKSEILNIKDKKIQDKVIKEIYGYENIEELKLIHGEDFHKEKDNLEDDDLESLRNEVKILKFNQGKEKLNIALERFVDNNKELFVNEGSLDKLKEEVKNFSDTLSPEDRIQRAAKIAFGVSPTDAAYRTLIEQSVGGGGKTTKEENEKTKTETQREIDNIFGDYFPKREK